MARRVFFLHVPKTGGISLSTFLSRLFAPEVTCRQPASGRVWDYTADDAAHYRLFAGHFDVDFIDLVDPCGFKLTILRDPLSRLISIYDFWRSISLGWADEHLGCARVDAPRFARTHTFGAFLRTDNPFVREAISNAMARQLLGRCFGAVEGNSAEAADMAFARLQTFDWYSTTEGLSAALPGLAAQLKVPPPDKLHVHQTYMPEPHEPRVPVTLTVPLRADISYCARINEIDLRLYRLAAAQLAQLRAR